MLAEHKFEIQTCPRASFGRGVAAKIGKRLKSRGLRHGFVVTDRGVEKAGLVSRLTAVLSEADIEPEVFRDIEENPRAATVERAAMQLGRRDKTVVIALGGGSVIDAAKAIALIAPNGGKVSEFGFGCRPEHPGHFVVAIPTTAGTGSETNMFGVVTDPDLGRKVLVSHPSVLPEMVILDPDLTVGLPAQVTANTGMDALTHAVEAFTSSRTNPFAEALALRAIAMVATYLPLAVSDGSDSEARAQMLVAAHLAGIAFSSAGLGICHAMGHPLSARFDLAHGQSLAALLPHVMRFNLELCTEKYAQVAIALGVTRDGNDAAANAERAIDAVQLLSQQVGTAKTLAELGVERDQVPTLVEDALADLLMATTPRYPSAEEVASVYGAAF